MEIKLRIGYFWQLHTYSNCITCDISGHSPSVSRNTLWQKQVKILFLCLIHTPHFWSNFGLKKAYYTLDFTLILPFRKKKGGQFKPLNSACDLVEVNFVMYDNILFSFIYCIFRDQKQWKVFKNPSIKG